MASLQEGYGCKIRNSSKQWIATMYYNDGLIQWIDTIRASCHENWDFVGILLITSYKIKLKLIWDCPYLKNEISDGFQNFCWPMSLGSAVIGKIPGWNVRWKIPIVVIFLTCDFAFSEAILILRQEIKWGIHSGHYNCHFITILPNAFI